MDAKLPEISVAEELAGRIAALDATKLPAALRRTCEDLLVDVAGLCVTVRQADYIKAALAGFDDEGACTAIGHARPLTAAGAAFVNGTAAHGEDFDDTFEGGPVHAGAVVVPAVLAIAEGGKLAGGGALAGGAGGGGVLWRARLGGAQRIHKAGLPPAGGLWGLG